MHRIEFGIAIQKIYDWSRGRYGSPRITKEILLKYKDIKGIKALPVKSEKEINEQLKVIGEILEFDRPVNYTYFVGEKRYDEVYPFYKVM
ncbi:TPA: hypothetical protein ACGZ96_003595, partial [Elizabethkingia anophelis]